MSEQRFVIKRNDTSPSIQRTLRDSAGDAIDLTGATVRFKMSTIRGVSKVDAVASIEDAANGLVQYDWQAADTDTAGLFYCEWEATYADSNVETFPNEGFNTVKIDPDL